MSTRILSVFLACLLLPVTTFALTSEEKLAEAIEQLMQQTQALQQQVSSLKAELDQVKHENKQLASAQTNTTPQPESKLKNTSQDISTLEAQQEKSELINFLIGSPVLTSPMLSVQSQYDAGDLIVNYPGINEDLFFLRKRKQFSDAIGAENLPSRNRPTVILSGTVEALFSYQNPFAPGPTTNSLELSYLELDAYAEVSPWAHGFTTILFDGSDLDPNISGSGNSANNSRLYIDRGFITIGNLTETPLYFSAGRMYVPFGRYSSNMFSNPMTKTIGRTNVNAALLGYAPGSVNVAGYVYDGGTNVGQSGIGGWGTNVGYSFSGSNPDDLNGTLGVGFINNIADSQGAQSPSSGGFSASPATEQLQHVVPGANIHAALDKGPLGIRTEFVTATSSYANSDMLFNGSGASPKAFHAETYYSFDIKNKPSNFTLAFDQTWEALAMRLPKNSYTATFNTSLWKNTVQTLEYRYDVNYSSTDTGSYLCPGAGGTSMLCPVTVTGKDQHNIFARLAVFF